MGIDAEATIASPLPPSPSPSTPSSPPKVRRHIEEHNLDEVRDRLFISAFTAVMSKPVLEALGITHVLSVLPISPHHFPGIRYKKLSVEDSLGANLFTHFPSCCAWIDESLQSGGSVIVHCAAGISRSATVVCAYLMYKENISAAAALRSLRNVHPKANPNPAFWQQLIRWRQILVARRHTASPISDTSTQASILPALAAPATATVAPASALCGPVSAMATFGASNMDGLPQSHQIRLAARKPTTTGEQPPPGRAPAATHHSAPNTFTPSAIVVSGAETRIGTLAKGLVQGQARPHSIASALLRGSRSRGEPVGAAPRALIRLPVPAPSAARAPETGVSQGQRDAESLTPSVLMAFATPSTTARPPLRLAPAATSDSAFPPPSTTLHPPPATAATTAASTPPLRSTPSHATSGSTSPPVAVLTDPLLRPATVGQSSGIGGSAVSRITLVAAGAGKGDDTPIPAAASAAAFAAPPSMARASRLSPHGMPSTPLSAPFGHAAERQLRDGPSNGTRGNGPPGNSIAAASQPPLPPASAPASVYQSGRARAQTLALSAANAAESASASSLAAQLAARKNTLTRTLPAPSRLRLFTGSTALRPLATGNIADRAPIRRPSTQQPSRGSSMLTSPPASPHSPSVAGRERPPPVARSPQSAVAKDATGRKAEGSLSGTAAIR